MIYLYAEKVKSFFTFQKISFERKKRDERKGFFAVEALTFFCFFGTMTIIVSYTGEGAFLWRWVLTIKSIWSFNRKK